MSQKIFKKLRKEMRKDVPKYINYIIKNLTFKERLKLGWRIIMKRLLILLCVFLVGCATMGTKLDTNIIDSIKEGVTTEAEVVELLGVPQSKIVTDSGNIQMLYVYTRSKSKLRNFIPYVGLINSGIDTTQQTVSILINKKGIVERLTTNENITEMKYGIVN